MLNLNLENLKYFITAIGAFFYARSIMRLIMKNILEIQNLLGLKFINMLFLMEKQRQKMIIL